MQVVSSISCIREDSVEFEDGKNCYFDSIVFATGYKSTANMWLKVCMYVCISAAVSNGEIIIFTFDENFNCGSLQKCEICNLPLPTMKKINLG